MSRLNLDIRCLSKVKEIQGETLKFEFWGYFIELHNLDIGCPSSSYCNLEVRPPNGKLISLEINSRRYP